MITFQEGDRQHTYLIQRSRADYRVTVADALDSFGLHAANESSWDFDVYWGSQWAEHAAYLDSRLGPRMLISSVLGLMAETLGDKDFLGYAVQLCAAQHGDAECDFVPPIYAMPHQADRWREAFRKHRYWIRKDKKVWGSAGVSIVSSRKALPAEGNPYLLQHYVTTPLLWHGFKHDLRLWAMVTSVRPLRVYLLQDGWARVAAKAYDADALDANLNDACMHLTATYCAELPSDSLRLMRTNLRSYRRGLATSRSFARELWPAIERAVLKSVLFVAPLLEGYDAMLKGEGATYRRFGFLSCDLIITDSGVPYVEEVNTNGFLMGTRIPNGWQYTVDAMNLLGVAGYARRPEYANRLEAAIAQLCYSEATDADDAGEVGDHISNLRADGVSSGQQRFSCGDAELEVMQQLVDESEHAGHFARLFPPSSRTALEALGPLALGATSSHLGALSAELAVHLYDHPEEEHRRGALVAEQAENAEDLKRWDWYGLEGNWRQAKAAVRAENRLLMDSIIASRNLDMRPNADNDVAARAGDGAASSSEADVVVEEDGGAGGEVRTASEVHHSRTVPA